MGFLSPEGQQFLKKEFAALTRDVELTLYTHESALVVPGEEVPYAREVRALLEEVAAQSPHIKLAVEDVRPSDQDALAAAGVERLPALFGAAGTGGARARYFGLPGGYELSTVIATILDIGADGGGKLVK